MDINNVWALSVYSHLKVLNHSILDHLHLLHHQRFLPLPAFHIVYSGLLDAVEDFLFRSLVNVVQNLKFSSFGCVSVPLVYICWVERFVIVDKISQIVSSYGH